MDKRKKYESLDEMFFRESIETIRQAFEGGPNRVTFVDVRKAFEKASEPGIPDAQTFIVALAGELDARRQRRRDRRLKRAMSAATGDKSC